MRAAILLVGLGLLAGIACGSARSAPETGHVPLPAAAIAPREAELRLDVAELTCHSCAGQVADGTARIPGVLRVSAQMLDHLLVVSYDPTRLTEAALIAGIDKVVDALAD